MIKLTITQIGTPKQYQGAKGPFEKNYLKATEYNNEFLNFFVNKTTSQWKVGQVIEVEAVEKREYTGKDGTLKTSYDIKLPRFGGNGDVMKALEEIRGTQTKHGLQLTQILEAVRQMYVANMPKVEDDYPTPESQGLEPENMADFDGLDQIDPLSVKGF